MHKHILSGVSGFALLLLVASPASAFWWPQPSNDLVVKSADITNKVEVSSNTGYNSQGTSGFVMGSSHGFMSFGAKPGMVAGENWMDTGNASAVGSIMNEVNNGDDCDCYQDVETVKFSAKLNNNLYSGANTGDNSQGTMGKVLVKPGMVFGKNGMQTGNSSAQGQVWNVVNSSVSFTE
jgi:hypothetical protein